MTKATTVRFPIGLVQAIRDEQVREHRGSQTETVTSLIIDGLKSRGVYNFNDACREIKMYWRRDEFHDWCRENGVPTFNTVTAWENYAQAFETDGDVADERATQQDALPGAS
jgi:hypothetical protein